MKSTPACALIALGLGIWHGHPTAPLAKRRVDEIQMVLLERGAATLRVGASTVRLEHRGLAAYWALTPHEIICATPATLIFKVAVPTREFLQWKLPGPFTRRLLRGRVLTERDQAALRLDAALFQKWLEDFEELSRHGRHILALEIQARFRRLAEAARVAARRRNAPEILSIEEADHALAMARFIAENYSESLHNADIAGAAHLNVQYATRLFSRTFGVTLHRYMNRYRIAHACRLLATTNRKVIDVAMESGFASPSRFYESFTRLCGQSPQGYRAAQRTEVTG